MPRGKKRTSTNDARQLVAAKRKKYDVNAKRLYFLRSTNLSENTFSEEHCLAWFNEYASPEEPNMIGPVGMERFCEDIGIEPGDIIMLILAFKMGARRMGYFSESEWLNGFKELQCDSLSKLQLKLETIKDVLDDPIAFKNLYNFTYDFAKNPNQRSLDIQTAKEMLKLLLTKNWPLIEQFLTFLDEFGYQYINKDQWYNILEFTRTIHINFNDYDFDAPWPVLLDEFVVWLRSYRQDS